jgi:predicted nucleic acid-binding protein
VQRILIDSDLYIDWIRAGLREDLIATGRYLRYLSTVVLLELQAGAFTRSLAAAVSDLHDGFRRTGRLLVPSSGSFWRAGTVLRILQRRYGSDPRKRFRLVNDCLIAMSSRQIGATVFTRNERDFQAIQRVTPFALAIVP